MHIHDTDEIMPNFYGKLTVGKYSPERVAPEMFGRSCADSVSHVSTDAQIQRVRSPLVAMRSLAHSPEPSLMLDQYLNVHSYSHGKDQNHTTIENRPGSNSKSSPLQLSNVDSRFPGDNDEQAGSRKGSPTRVDIPLLAIGENSKINLSTFSGTDSSISPAKTSNKAATTEFSPNQEAKIPTAGLTTEDYSKSQSNPPSISFDDSAPPSAALLNKRPDKGAGTEILTSANTCTRTDTPLQFEATPDATSPGGLEVQVIFEMEGEVTAESTRANTAGFSPPTSDYVSSEQIEHQDDPPTPPPPLSNRSSFANASPQFHLFEHKSVDAAVPPYAMRTLSSEEHNHAGTVSSSGKRTGSISAVVVRLDGSPVASPDGGVPTQRFEESTDFLNLASTERSLGLESTISGKIKYFRSFCW